MDEALKRTQLYDWHVAHGGRMVGFAGWEMPVYYPTGAIEEHHITRRSAGLFDIDHMGQIKVSGPDAEEYLNRLVSWDIRGLKTHESHYALMCYEDGGIVDDVFIYRRPDHWFVVVNASNLEKDFQWLLGHAQGFLVELTNVSDETYMLALQGPQALPILQSVVSIELGLLQRFFSAEDTIAGVRTLIGRTGYTGEDGVELFFPATEALKIWTTLLEAGAKLGLEIQPIGLAARDSLRFEPAFPLYGHEIDAHISPLEANLGWACSLEKDFIGRDALVQQKTQGLTKKLIGFELLEKSVARQGYAVTDSAGQPLGEVVEGLYAPTVDKYCGHAFVPPAFATPGTPLNIIIRGKPKAAVVVKRPFYRPAYRA